MKPLLLIGLMILGLASGCGPKNRGAETPASVEDLNRALTVVTMRSGGFPPATNELAAFLKLSGQSMPVPPLGKKLVLDPDTRQFILVDE